MKFCPLGLDVFEKVPGKVPGGGGEQIHAQACRLDCMSVFCFNKLKRERAYLAATMGVPVEAFLRMRQGRIPRARADRREPGRPAIYIE